MTNLIMNINILYAGISFEKCILQEINSIDYPSHPFFLGVDRTSESVWWLLSDRSVDDM